MNNLYVWGNHHCSNSSGFQDALNDLVEQCTTFPRPVFHQIDSFREQSITELKHNLDNKPAILVAIVGDEILKEEQLVCEIVEQFKLLFTMVSQFPRLKLVTCGLIPEKHASIHSQHRFGSANYQLKTLHSNSRHMFVQTDGIFNSLDFKSLDCLNYKGSKKLARTIMKYLNTKFPNYFITIRI